MKLLLIKIGKAWHTLQREGLLRGGRRVLLAGLALFRPVRPGDILFISGGVGDSARYRCEHVAEACRLRGLRASVTVQDNPFLVSYAERFSVFVFHRVLYMGQAKQLFERLKQLGKTIIFETDDLVYDPQYLVHMDYYRRMNQFERKLYEHGVGGEMLADPSVSVATTSTAFLADKLREKGKRVFIVPNMLSQEDMVWAEEALKDRRERLGSAAAGPETVSIGYLSGTPSHDKDFATITPALTQILRRFPAVRLVLVGPLETGPAFEPYQNQIERIPFVPRSEYFRVMASLDINLAPLELGNPFCESKSELKFFEAGSVAVSTVAVANQTYREAIRDGVDGFVAGTTEEWVDKLTRLIENPTLRERLGAEARKTALRRYTTEQAPCDDYFSYLRERIEADQASRKKRLK